MSKIPLSIRYLVVILVICSFTSCKKQESQKLKISAKGAKAGPIPAFYFNWEISTYMPSIPANVVPMPWQGSVGGVDAAIVSDYKKADGWEMVYNTFDFATSPTIAKPGGLYFGLYNKYRGLLRFYLYIPPGTSASSSQIVHGLSLFGASNWRFR